jgi:hypothetical protein
MKYHARIDDLCLTRNEVRLTEDYDLPHNVLGVSCTLKRCLFLHRGNSGGRNAVEHPRTRHQAGRDAIDSD